MNRTGPTDVSVSQVILVIIVTGKSMNVSPIAVKMVGFHVLTFYGYSYLELLIWVVFVSYKSFFGVFCYFFL